jgi:hypothetical protein
MPAAHPTHPSPPLLGAHQVPASRRPWSPSRTRSPRRRSFWLWTLVAVAFAVLLRAPWIGAPLGNDEGGLAYIAAHWHAGGPDLYGHYFIDRPPLLLAAFRLADATGGADAVRVIGAVASALLVVITALLGRELGGTRSGLIAGSIAAALGSSVLLGSVLTPAELLAVLPSAGSVLLLVVGMRAARREHLALALAGCLAACALLVKQSFGDALVAGAVFLVAGALLDDGNRRRWLGLAGAYCVGVAAVVLGLELWETLDRVPEGATSYALLGFRVQGLSALAGSAGGLPGRLSDRLALPFVGSGLALIMVWSAFGVYKLKSNRVLQLAVAAWLGAGVAGVLLGGSYWSHYLIELIPGAAVTAGWALARSSRRLVLPTLATLAVLTVGGALVGSQTDAGASLADQRPKEIGQAIAQRAERDDTIYVRYSQPNITYYSGLRNPYPYDWSLMLRTVPGAQAQLRNLLGSTQRPTWIVDWESDTSYGLDTNGRTQHLLNRYYRPAGSVDGIQILLRRGQRRGAI